MKKLQSLATIACLALMLTGCAHLSSTTESSMPIVDQQTGKTNWVTQKTSMRVYTVLDANSSLAKAANQSSASGSSNSTFAPGTHLSGLNQNSSGSNLVQILGAITTAAVNAAK